MTNERAQEKYLKFPQRRFRLDVSKNFFMKRNSSEDTEKLPREVVESLYLELFRRCVDVPLKDMVK